MAQKNVFVIGSNGYIGSAVCRAFVRAGWQVFGLIRRKESAAILIANETIPIVGSLSELSALETVLFTHSKTFDVIAGCVEPPDYVSYVHEAVTAIRHIAATSNAHQIRPLVLWSSGCKDYGTTAIDGSPKLAPHTESSPINPPAPLVARATHSLRLFEQTDLFDAAILRPTNVYGHSSSYYGGIFQWAAANAAKGAHRLTLKGVDPSSIMHAMHVDDCGEAYVALADHADRSSVTGECFNISASKYETAKVVLTAFAEEYGFPDGTNFEPNSVEPDHGMGILFGFSQWVGSDKIRKLTGWTDRQMLFSKNLGVYRRSYEAAVGLDHEDVARVEARQKMWATEALDT